MRTDSGHLPPITVKDWSLKGDFVLMCHTRQRKRHRSFDSDDGFVFVVCGICGDHRRVINSQHLSKHDTDRDTYMEEYHLTPDELIAKDFRVLQSSRRGYYPNGKNEWIAAMKKVYKKDGKHLVSSVMYHADTDKGKCDLNGGRRLGFVE